MSGQSLLGQVYRCRVCGAEIAVLSRRADELGLARKYPKAFGVVRVRPVRIDGPVMVKRD